MTVLRETASERSAEETRRFEIARAVEEQRTRAFFALLDHRAAQRVAHQRRREAEAVLEFVI